MDTFAKIAKKLPLSPRYPVPFFISVSGKETKISVFRYFRLPIPIGAGGKGGGRRQSGEKGVGESVENRIER
jgi:hypothetical protein